MASSRTLLLASNPGKLRAVDGNRWLPYTIGMSAALPKLSLDLEAIALRQVRRSYLSLNASLFQGKLRTPVFSFSDGRSTLGSWRSAGRRLDLSRSLLTEHTWGRLIEVLKHEMAHQYVDEVLGAGAEQPHGDCFREVCDERGIDAAAQGVPRDGGQATEQSRVLDRIAKLLALAESTNRHEAEAAASAAQRLMLKYNIEAALSQEHGAYSFRQLGQPSGRIDESQRLLSVLLDEFFFVEAIWVPVWRPLENKRGSVLEICGSRDNLEMAEYVYSYLVAAGEQLWLEHKREQGLTRNAHRRSFLAGVMNGFMQRLERERATQRREGLVWRGDPRLHQYFRRRHPYVRRSGRSARHDHASFRAGCEAGDRIVLRRGLKRGPSGTVRLLNGKR